MSVCKAAEWGIITLAKSAPNHQPRVKESIDLLAKETCKASSNPKFVSPREFLNSWGTKWGHHGYGIHGGKVIEGYSIAIGE